MASLAERNAISVLVMVELTEQMLAKSASPSLGRLLGRVDSAIDQCWPHWQVLERKEVEKLYETIKGFDRRALGGVAHPPAVYTSLLLGLVNAVSEKVKGSRAAALGQLESAIRALHRHYDRTGRRWDEYRLAGGFLEMWG